jgi:hypothetical protein
MKRIIKNTVTSKEKYAITILCGVCLGVVFAVAGCERLEPVDTGDGDISPSNDTITLGYRQIYCDTTRNFCLQLGSILDDSRCPTGAICCWIGMASVSFDFTYGGNRHCNFVLGEMGMTRETSDTTINNIYFKLLSLDPYPDVNAMPMKQEDYVVKVLVLQNNQ